jgi:hypothetical protein
MSRVREQPQEQWGNPRGNAPLQEGDAGDAQWMPMQLGAMTGERGGLMNSMQVRYSHQRFV